MIGRSKLVLTAMVLITGMIAAWSPGVAQATGPTITTLAPASGAVGASVKITGTGFTGATEVNFNGVSVASNFKVKNDTTITTIVPTLASTGTVTVTTPGGTATSPSPFSVTLGLYLNNTSGPPTSTVAIAGSGFGAHELVDVYFDTTDIALAATDANGNFTNITVTVPASAVPGTHWISAAGRRTGLGTQTSFLVRTNWPQFRGGVKHRGVDTTENVLSPDTVGGLDQDWTYLTGGAIDDSSAAVVNGIVYVGSDDGKLYAINATTGAKLWDTGTAMSGPARSSPAVVGGIVYVGSFDDSLYAFNATTGAKLWSAATGALVESSPAVVNGVVYVGSADDKLYAYNAATGAKLWDTGTAIGGEVIAGPAVANGLVFVSAFDGKLYAFTTAGSLLWATSDIFAGGASAAVANGVVYVGTGDGKLYAFNAANGDEVWDTGAAIGGGIFSAPAVANGVVYIGSMDDKLYAFDTNTGDEIWDSGSTFNDAVDESPVVANGVVYVGDNDGNGETCAFDASYGGLLWSAHGGDGFVASPVVDDGVVYAGSNDGRLYAWDLVAAPKPPARPSLPSLRPDHRLAIGD